MAFKPSRRSSYKPEEVELNLFPIMNMMVVLIPLLLSTTMWVKIGMIELNLPKASGGPASATTLVHETKPGLDITVTITSKGFFLSSSQAIMKDASGGPAIPLLSDGSYNYDQLNKKLYELKQRIGQSANDTKEIIIQAEMNVEYQTIISTMDAARSTIIGKTKYELFPDVIISAGVV